MFSIVFTLDHSIPDWESTDIYHQFARDRDPEKIATSIDGSIHPDVAYAMISDDFLDRVSAQFISVDEVANKLVLDQLILHPDKTEIEIFKYGQFTGHWTGTLTDSENWKEIVIMDTTDNPELMFAEPKTQAVSFLPSLN